MKTIVLLLQALFFIKICKCVTYTYPGKGFTKYPRLKSSQTTRISFEFQTTSSAEINLFYVDDVLRGGKSGDFLRVWLDGGRMKLKWMINNENFLAQDHKEIGHNLDDNIKHYVIIERYNGKDFLIRVDGEEVQSSFLKAVRFDSHIFVGGCHPDPGKRTLQRDANFCWQDGFIGCISNLRWTTEHEKSEQIVKPIETYNVTKGCTNRCLTDPSFECENGGRCLNKYISTGCDCRGTGFTGTKCQKPKQAVTFSGEQYVTWSPQTNMNSLVTDIFVRFKSNQLSGIILLITGQGKNEFMLLEMYERALILKIKINGYDEKVFKIPKSSNEKANNWRIVSISRMGASTTLAMNDGIHEYTNSVKQLENKIVQAKFIIKRIFFGGIDRLGVHQKLGNFAYRKSDSKTNFIGCLQNVDINQFELVERIVTTPNDNSITLFGGSLQKGACKVLPAMDNKLTPTSIVDEFITPKPVITVAERNMTGNKLPENYVQNEEEKSKSMLWIIVVSCISFVVLSVAIVCAVRHVVKRRQAEHRRYHDHYLRQTAMRVEQEDLLPTEQKCIREEIAKRKLQTFSPLRKDFYVSSSSHAGTLPRSVHHEPIYQSHEVFHHAHPCIGKNYAVPSIQEQQTQNCASPVSSHYGISRKCSHGSTRYQTPNVKPAESIKSFSSQQS